MKLQIIVKQKEEKLIVIDKVRTYFFNKAYLEVKKKKDNGK